MNETDIMENVDPNIRISLSPLSQSSISNTSKKSCKVNQEIDVDIISNITYSTIEEEEESAVSIPLSIKEINNFGLKGIINQGATCYLSSLIQVLFHCRKFREGLLQFRHPSEQMFVNYLRAALKGEYVHHTEEFKKDIMSQWNSVTVQLQVVFGRLLDQSTNGRNNSVNPNDLIHSFGWSESECFQQHDVQEMKTVLFSELESVEYEEIKRIPKIFQGKLFSYIRCLKCNQLSSREEGYQDIDLVVNNRQCDQSVRSCLQSYLDTEKLEKENQYFCEKCDIKVDAEKGVEFSKLPPVLVIQLKRFAYDYDKSRRVKNQANCLIDLELFQNDFLHRRSTNKYNKEYLREIQTVNASNYHLTAVIVHTGEANCGHYTCYCKCFNVKGKFEWFEFNDTKITKLPQKQFFNLLNNGHIANGGAYLCFYSKEGEDTCNYQDIPEYIKLKLELEKKANEVNKVGTGINSLKVHIVLEIVRESKKTLFHEASSVMNALRDRIEDLEHLITSEFVKNEKTLFEYSGFEKLEFREYFVEEHHLGPVLPSEFHLYGLKQVEVYNCEEPVLLAKIDCRKKTGERLNCNPCSDESEVQLKLCFHDRDHDVFPVSVTYDYCSTQRQPLISDLEMAASSSLENIKMPPIIIPGQVTSVTVKNIKIRIQSCTGIPMTAQILHVLNSGCILKLDNECSYLQAYNINNNDVILVGIKTPIERIRDSNLIQNRLLDIGILSESGIKIEKKVKVMREQTTSLQRIMSVCYQELLQNGIYRNKSFNVTLFTDYLNRGIDRNILLSLTWYKMNDLNGFLSERTISTILTKPTLVLFAEEYKNTLKNCCTRINISSP